MKKEDRVNSWFVSITESVLTLRQAYNSLQEVGLCQEDVPLIVKLAENPAYNLPGFEIFSGAADLETHDYIHILLGRGLCAKDEAFVLGFTMGSTNRMTVLEEKLYGFFTKHLYPKNYRFSDDDFEVYKDAVRLSYVSHCVPLNNVNYHAFLDMSLAEARRAIGIPCDLLMAYYRIEKSRYPGAFESQRLLAQ